MTIAFSTGLQLQLKRPVGRSTCGVRKTVTTRAMAESWEKQAEWNAAGRGIQAKGLQQIEFTIHQDGTVEEKVFGVRGKDCIAISEKIEKVLGKVVHREKTEEFFEQVYETIPVANEQVVEDQVVQPGDPLYVADPDVPSW